MLLKNGIYLLIMHNVWLTFYLFFYFLQSKRVVVIVSTHPFGGMTDGTVHIVKLHSSPTGVVSLWRVRLSLDGGVSVSLVIRRVSQDAGLFIKPWAFHCGSMSTEKWKLFCRPSLSFAPNPPQCCPHERGSWSAPAPFQILWRLRRSNRSLRERVTSRGRLTGAVARLSVERCLPSRERCPICVPGRRVCKDHFTFLSSRNDSESAVSRKARG